MECFRPLNINGLSQIEDGFAMVLNNYTKATRSIYSFFIDPKPLGF